MKTITEKEAVLRERAAYLAGIKNAPGFVCSVRGPDCAMCSASAAERYPLPKVTRPRIETDRRGHQWRWADGRLQFRQSLSSGWLFASPPFIDDDSRAAVQSVLSDPTEEVEEEA